MYLHTLQVLQEETKGHSFCLEHRPAQKPFSFFLSFQEKDLHMCKSPGVHQIRRILRAFLDSGAEEITWEQRCFWDVTLRKYKVACVNFQEIFLLFFFQPKGLEPHLYDCFFFSRTRCACSTKDIPIIQGNQQSTLQEKIRTNKLYKQNSNQKI